MDRNRIEQLAELYRSGLETTVRFWQDHAVDEEQGGFFTLLDRVGRRYGDDKPVWLQGRATWLFATLHEEFDARAAWLDLARHGYRFLTSRCFDERGKLYFLVDRAGRPLRMRRYVYSEVFAILAFAALARATGEPEHRRRAIGLFDTFHKYLTTPNAIEPKTDPHTRPMKGLAPLMCLLNVADTMLLIDRDGPYETIIDACIAEIFSDFVDVEQRCVPETVAPDGGRVEGPDGRMMNPGHVIEAAWFMLEIARRRGDRELVQRAAPLIEWSLERGWDEDYGGILYFVDIDGMPPTQLEHDMKLWWPHCEALYATLLAHHLTGDARYERLYDRVHAYTFNHFPDSEHGEWFGYLRRDGKLSTPLKGGVWKGPFHVPRAQLYCWKLLEEMRGKEASR